MRAVPVIPIEPRSYRGPVACLFMAATSFAGLFAQAAPSYQVDGPRTQQAHYFHIRVSHVPEAEAFAEKMLRVSLAVCEKAVEAGTIPGPVPEFVKGPYFHGWREIYINETAFAEITESTQTGLEIPRDGRPCRVEVKTSRTLRVEDNQTDCKADLLKPQTPAVCVQHQPLPPELLRGRRSADDGGMGQRTVNGLTCHVHQGHKGVKDRYCLFDPAADYGRSLTPPVTRSMGKDQRGIEIWSEGSGVMGLLNELDDHQFGMRVSPDIFRIPANIKSRFVDMRGGPVKGPYPSPVPYPGRNP